MNYQIGHVYKILCIVNSDFVYIGSTFRQLNLRWQRHINHYKLYLKKGILNMSTHKYFDKYGIQNFKIVLIKSYKVSSDSNWDNKELKVFEQLWINKTKNSVNRQCAFNPLAKLDHKIIMSKYYENNKEQVNECNKKWYNNNKEKKNQKGKEWRNDNKEKINKREREKITCECGSIISKKSIPRHKKSKKHAKLMQNNNTLKIL